MPKFEKSTGYQMKGSSFYGKGNSSPVKQDKFGDIKKDQYPNLVEDITKVQKDEKGLYVTGREPKGSIHSIGPHSISDTTRFPKGFSDWRGELKEGDRIDETSWDAWGGVDVEEDPPVGEGQKATGKRKVYSKKAHKYVDYKDKKSPAKDFEGVKDPEKRKKLSNLYKHAEEFKGDPDYWKKVKGVLGVKEGGAVSYKGKEY